MKAYIEIQSQRGQSSGKLEFVPARNVETKEHELIKKTFDRLMEDLAALEKASLVVAPVAPAVVEAEAPKPSAPFSHSIFTAPSSVLSDDEAKPVDFSAAPEKVVVPEVLPGKKSKKD